MTLMRAFSKIDKDGKIKLPGNIQREAGLKEGQLVELKIVGASKKKNILVSARNSARQIYRFLHKLKFFRTRLHLEKWSQKGMEEDAFKLLVYKKGNKYYELEDI